MKKLWLVIVGVMLCIALPSLASPPRADPKPTKVEVVGEVKVAGEPAKPDLTAIPCDPSMDIRTSDLCAQWKAADAAKVAAEAGRDSAKIAWYGLLTGIALNSITLIFLLITFNETRKTTKAAIRALHVDKAKMMLKTPKFIPDVRIDGNQRVKRAAFASLDWENVGGRPAIHVGTGVKRIILPKGSPVPKPIWNDAPDDWATVAPGETHPGFRLLQSNNAVEEMLSAANDCYIFGVITWRDRLESEVTDSVQVLVKVKPLDVNSFFDGREVFFTSVWDSSKEAKLNIGHRILKFLHLYRAKKAEDDDEWE
ncbi:hypothetical protein [Asticcacaulis sp.]|uniref:hypothetical protein n=1 Tax=Asticcacaulis sp. TaxID=1872648 RepID=UPI002C8DFB6A|nr:hypothetical protein [Asticcacaulis sp.]HTM81963.1 hypothetical protein [Asticcacaulis sp.]